MIDGPLRDLPPSEDSFWEGAELEITSPQAEVCNHYFEQIDRFNLYCINCNIGFRVDAWDEIKDGHLYKDNELII